MQVLAGLKLFDQESIRAEYNMMNPAVKKIAEDFIRETRTAEKRDPTIGHKEFITRIRNTKY